MEFLTKSEKDRKRRNDKICNEYDKTIAAMSTADNGRAVSIVSARTKIPRSTVLYVLRKLGKI